MKKALKYLSVLIAIGVCGFAVYGLAWVRQYQSLTDEV